MSYTLACPFCNARIDVPDELNDTTAACPSCNQEIYLTREEAVEDSDPALEAIRRQNAAADRAHREELRQVMMVQDQLRQSRENTKAVVNVILWIFLWGPLCLLGLWLVFLFFLRVATGHW